MVVREQRADGLTSELPNPDPDKPKPPAPNLDFILDFILDAKALLWQEDRRLWVSEICKTCLYIWTERVAVFSLSKSGDEMVFVKGKIMATSPRNSKVPADHLTYLQQRPFVFGCETSVFPPDELEALTEYGNWLQALAAGVIQPASAEQEHFLQVDREEARPQSVRERAWVRLKGRREYEREQMQKTDAPPPAPAENYGIVEWDADRCWW